MLSTQVPCTALPLNMGHTICPETSVTSYESTLRNIGEERRTLIYV